MKNTIVYLCLIACGLVLSPQVMRAGTYTVTSTADSGPGTLRQAIIDANTNPGLDTIRFNISTGGGNLFEGSAPNTYAVIEVNNALPTITGAVYINGSTQSNTNPGNTVSQLVGVDNISTAAIPYPDIYIVPSATFSFSNSPAGIAMNGLTIDVAGVTIRGIAISGFGNTNTNGGNASAHSDISILRSPTPRTINFTITECFLSCNPRGATPTAAQRLSKANGLLVLGNNQTGTISNNYIAYSGTYGIHFNGNTDNLGVGPASTTIGNRYWTISGNIIQFVTTNAGINALTRVNDGINLMKCVNFRILNNYINDIEQSGIDIGYNSDSNYIENNTITGITRTNYFGGIQAGLRIGLCSEKDTLIKNVIANNTGSLFKAGIWIDESTLIQTGVIVKNNSDNLIQQNQINDNNASGIVLSNNSTGGCFNNKITRNSIYNNAGLGIDLNYNGTAGPTAISFNDDTDPDAGPNNIQNFPIVDSMRLMPGNQVAIYGKAPAGSTIEFFLTDGQANSFGSAVLNYGEGKTYIGTAVEGSAQDLASGTTSYNLDGNVATAENRFHFVLTYTIPILLSDYMTSTATIGNNTSEFSPTAGPFAALAVKLHSFSAVYSNDVVNLKWKASNDADFAYFDVEYSSDSKNFKSLGRVYSRDRGQIAEYEFADMNFTEGKNFYRLRMVGNSGNVNLSSILNVNVKKNAALDLRVNTVFSTQLNMAIPVDQKSTLQIHLLSSAGQILKSLKKEAFKGLNYVQMDNLNGLPAGTYFLRIQTPDNTYLQKLIKGN
jgi:parallel beta helix pectate lyase-like protein